MKNWTLAVALGTAVVTATIGLGLNPASAILFPVPDFKGSIPPGGIVRTITTNVPPFTIIDIPGLCLKCNGLTDKINVRNPYPVPIPIFALTWVKIPFLQFLNAKNIDLNSEVTFIDIYALDLQPSKNPNEIPLVTGFNPANPEITLESDETFFGAITGNPYTSFSTTTSALQDLPTLFPDFDLSAFTGNPDSIVYITQTNIPLSDVGVPCIPEPSSILGLLAVGTLGAGTTLNRKLKPSKSSEKETTKVS